MESWIFFFRKKKTKKKIAVLKWVTSPKINTEPKKWWVLGRWFFLFFLPKVYSQVPAVHLPGCTAWKRTHWAKLIKLMKLLGGFPYSLVFQIPNVRIGAILVSPSKKRSPSHFFYPQNSPNFGEKTSNLWARNGWNFHLPRGGTFPLFDARVGTHQVRSFPCRNGPWELGWRAILNIAIEILSFFVKTVITMDFLVDFFGTGKYADTSPMNCVIKGFWPGLFLCVSLDLICLVT